MGKSVFFNDTLIKTWSCTEFDNYKHALWNFFFSKIIYFLLSFVLKILKCQDNAVRDYAQ